MSIKFGARLVHSICSIKVPQLHTLPDWCFYTTMYNEPHVSHTIMSYYVVIDRFTVSAVIHQRSCSIMSSFDYGQTALLRFVVDLL